MWAKPQAPTPQARKPRALRALKDLKMKKKEGLTLVPMRATAAAVAA
jgi:hypothetical protein